MKSKGRPRTAPIQLKNGFYIEVCNKGMKHGVKIWSISQADMEYAASLYRTTKDVIILGEYSNGIPLQKATAWV